VTVGRKGINFVQDIRQKRCESLVETWEGKEKKRGESKKFPKGEGGKSGLLGRGRGGKDQIDSGVKKKGMENVQKKKGKGKRLTLPLKSGGLTGGGSKMNGRRGEKKGCLRGDQKENQIPRAFAGRSRGKKGGWFEGKKGGFIKGELFLQESYRVSGVRQLHRQPK